MLDQTGGALYCAHVPRLALRATLLLDFAPHSAPPFLSDTREVFAKGMQR